MSPVLDTVAHYLRQPPQSAEDAERAENTYIRSGRWNGTVAIPTLDMVAQSTSLRD